MRVGRWMLAALLVLGTAAAARAESVTVTPAAALVVPAEGTGMARVLLRFEVPAAAGAVRIDQAVLDWPVAGMAADRVTWYEAYAVAEAWTAEGIAEGSVPAVQPEPADLWDFAPLDHARNGGTGLIRFRLETLAAAWLADPQANHGIVVMTPDWDAAALLAQAPAAVLTVRYGVAE